MRSRLFNAASGYIGAVLLAASTLSVAAPVAFFGVQAPKSPLTNNPTPPSLGAAVSKAQSDFNAAMTPLGRNEFEGGINATYGATAGTGNFSYTGGTATLTGGTVVGAIQSSPDRGRYNMSAGVVNDPATSSPTGHWLEATTDFTYNFSSAISALSFFGTDFGDLRGTFGLSIYSGNTLLYSSGNIVNTLVDTLGRANGNLLFFGITSDVSFDRAVFSLTQSAAGATNPDVLGFDSIVVGRASPIPEPTSVALVGLALCGLGAAGAKRRRML